MNFKCIIFDCDGVLVDSEPISARILIEMALELGVSFNQPLDDIMVQFSGVSLQYSMAVLQERLGCDLPMEFESEFRRRTFSAFREELQPVPGVKELLEKLNVIYGVASSGPREKITLNLRLTGLLEKFEGRIYSSYDINSWKPEPGIFLYAARSMGFPPSDCAVIEDSVSGVIAARKGGFKVFGYATDFTHSLLEREGAITFHSMLELMDLPGIL